MFVEDFIIRLGLQKGKIGVPKWCPKSVHRTLRMVDFGCFWLTLVNWVYRRLELL